ncbi:MAG TPA: nuclear transport factor 2 family protein [Solirubrobacteraceae bacterium]|nr:nuclear transport factor 2 family protein [Solirubrobacteraceae bacterium]
MSTPSKAPTRADSAPEIGRPHLFLDYGSEQVALFAAEWLAAWSGNDQHRLASFYARDNSFSNPYVPEGIRGREALTAYLERLLARYPDWVWTQTASATMRDGFVNFWQALVPIGRAELILSGVCLVELGDGLIARNQVFFDRSPLLDAIDARGSVGRTAADMKEDSR